MLSKIGKIIISIILSFVVMIATGVAAAWAAGYIVGSTVDSNGDEVLSGGGATGLAIAGISILSSVAFGIWFYKYVHLYAKKKNEELQK